MAATNWAAPGASVTLTATPDAGMIAVWLVTDKFGNLTTLKGSSVNYTMPVCPASASLSFAPEGALTSADDIYAAIAAAEAGSTVNLCAGTFTLTNSIVLDKAVTLKGAGADKTILLMPTKADFTAVKISHDDAVLEGVTLTGVYFASKPSSAAVGGTYNAKGEHQQNNPLGVKMSAGTFRNSIVRDNYATLQYGWGIWTDMTGGTVDNVQYLDNYYNRTGNAANGYVLRMSGGTVTNCVFSGNGCTGEDTGAVHMTGGTIVDSAIHHNDGGAANYYGGLYMNNSKALALRCRIYNNNNGLYLINGTVANCLVYNNGKAGNGGYYAGVSQSGGNLYYCTIFGNVSQADPDGRSGLMISGGTAKNNIVFGNGPAGSTVGSVRKTGGTFQYNLTDKAIDGTGNAVGNPAFADAANGDFSLTLGSVAVGMGAAITGYTTDFALADRAATPSVGAYEYAAGTELACGIEIGQDVFKEGADATVTAVVEGATDPTYQWYVDGVLSSATAAAPSFSGLSVGHHTVRLVVTDGGSSVEATIADAVTVKPTTVYVATDTTPVYPYNTAETAANSINDALTAVYSDATTVGHVIVAAGLFREPGTITIGSPVEVVGAGRDQTVISGVRFKDNGRGAYLADARALLKDLTITGCTNKSHGVGVYMTNGTLNNVHVTRSYQTGSSDNFNHGAGVLMENGVITNSLIDYNYLNANYHGSQGVGVYMSGGKLVDSEIAYNWMTRTQHDGLGLRVAGGTVTRCRIHHNYSTSNSVGGSGATHYSSGHGIYITAGVVEDSLIYSNGWNGVMLGGGTLRNSLVFGHREGSGDYFAGVNNAGGNVINCTITDNYASGDTNGKSGLWMTSGTAVNNIIYGNGKDTLGSTCVSGGTFKTNILDKATAYASAAQITVADPKFVSAYDFHIQNGSSAIDAGAPLLDHDLDGVARPQRNGHDIGCYELEPSTERTVAISASQLEYRAGATVSAHAEVENIETASATFSWTLLGPDGTSVDSKSGTGDAYLAYSFANAPVGTNTLTLVVTDNGDDLSADAPVVFSLKPTTVYVATDGGNIEPYDTQEKAARNVNDAFGASWQALDTTTTVHIAAGEYRLTDGFVLATPVRVCGAGREATVLNGSAIPTSSAGLTLNHEDAAVSGLTLDGCTNYVNQGSSVRLYKGLLDSVRISRGYLGNCGNEQHQGAGLYQTGGIATNCVIERCGCGTGWGDTSGVGLKMTGGLFVDGEISDNILNRHEHHGAGVSIVGGTVRHTKMTGNRGDYGSNSYGSVYVSGSGVIEDCEIVGPGRGNGVYVDGGTIRNSLVTGFKETTTVSSHGAGGLTLWGGNVINCTIAGNETTVAGMSADLTQTGGAIKNSIAPEADLAGGTRANNVFNADPKFVNAAKGKFRLLPSSPAVDAGDNAAWTWSDLGTAKDLDGKTRCIGGVINCGCFEWIPGTLLLVR